MSEAERLMHQLWSKESNPGSMPMLSGLTRKKTWQALEAAIRAMAATPPPIVAA